MSEPQAKTPGTPLILAEAGQTRYTIVIPATACDAEEYAAAELAHFLEEMTGARFPVQRDDLPAASCEITIGDTSRQRLDGLPADLTPQAWEGFAIVRDAARLSILGNIPRATLYGVYDFLHEELGCRFLTPEVNHVPKHATLEVNATSRRFDPVTEYREIWNGFSHQPQHYKSPNEKTRFDDAWAARNHLNLFGSTPDMEAMLGKVKWVGPSFVHTFNYMIPVEEHFDAHPEYFSEVDGVRVSEHDGLMTQLCLTNPDVLRLCLEKAREWIDSEVPNPHSKFLVSVTINDTDIFCKCPPCVAINEEEGVDEGGTKMRFVNAIATELAKEYSNVAVETMIYKTDVPKKTPPASNVIIRNVSGINWQYSLHDPDCPASVRMTARFQELSAATSGKGIYNWSKHTDFADFLNPNPNLRFTATNFRFMNEHGVVGPFAQNQQSPGTEMQELRFYVIARAMWRPDSDSVETITEFCKLCYGAAGDDVLRYVNFLHDEYCDIAPDLPLDDAFIARSNDILAQAESKAETPETRQRVATYRLPTWKIQLDRACGEIGKIFSFPVEWPFRIDPADEGLVANWQGTEAFDDWQRMRIDTHWTLQGEPHRGVAWYGIAFDLPDANDAPLALWFDAIDGDTDVFVDGIKIGEQKLSANLAWIQGFFVALPDDLAPGPHVLTLRLEKHDQNAGIWRPVSIIDMSVPIPAELRTIGERFLEVARNAKLMTISECYGEPYDQVEKMLYPRIEFFLKHGQTS